MSVTATSSTTPAADAPNSQVSPDELARLLNQRAAELGFDLCGVAPAASPGTLDHLHAWLERAFAGEMTYLQRREAAYQSPANVLPGVKSVVMLGMNYHTREPECVPRGQARVARYAWGSADYHDLIRDRLHQLSGVLHQHRPGCRTRGVVDTAPLLERDFARLAGLGWFGKNTMLINKRLGSWLFLAAVLTDVALPADSPHETAHCGTCTRCLDACPTHAFPEPYVLDASRCISYLTIELRGRPIPEPLREGVGDWLFGCDVCNDVCPWNRKAPLSAEPAFQPVPDLAPADAAHLLTLSPDQFHARFGQTPLARPGRDGVLRNAAIVLGNTRDRRFEPPLLAALDDESELVRDAARWGLDQIRNSGACHE